jgi:cellulose synthase/poly-beta-1,6-N-acetylglucosamine synthase-like glycosyltransferase
MAEMLLILLTALLAYIYLGYPCVLWLMARWFPREHRSDEGFQPTVTLIISAHNEAGVIGAKLGNSLELEYPAEKLRIMVVSDCSTDHTDDLVRSLAGDRVTLVRSQQRLGKTAGLNLALELITSDIVVFSDANAMYDSRAIQRLVRHFADDAVGYVVGHARYGEAAPTAAGTSESSYWNLEVLLKQWESAFSSVVGGDGAIYAIRRHLYEPLQQSDINDFVNPLQIVAKGYRGVFDPQAWCLEMPANAFGKEYSRKVRIVNRSFNGLLRVPQVCNPLRFARFSWQLLSHKLLRWFSPYLVALHLLVATMVGLYSPRDLPSMVCSMLYGTVAALAFIGWCLDHRGGSRAFYYLPYYFVLMNIASATGILLRLKGTVICTWETVREQGTPGDGERSWLPLVLTVIMGFCLIRIFLAFPDGCGVMAGGIGVGAGSGIL